MSSPPGEAPVAPPEQASDEVAPATIPPQATATGAADDMAPPVTGTVGDRPALNGSVRSAARPADDVVGPPLPTHAGVVTRLLAAIVDAAAIVVLTAMLDLAAAGARFLWSPVDFRWPRPETEVIVIVLGAVAVVYLTAGWALAGRTYGARLMGLRVLSSQKVLLGWIRSALRAIVCVIWPLGLFWCGISRTRSSLADLLVRSVVVYDTQPFARVRD